MALEPLGIVNAGAQTCVVRVLEGEYKGLEVTANNLQNAALDKDKLFAPGDRALAMIQPTESGEFRVTMIDHYRLDTEGLLFGLFGLLLILFGGVSGCGALISLVLSVMLVWKVLIPLMLAGYAPIWMALLLVVVLTAMIDLLVAGFTRKALVAMLGSLQGTALTCVLAVVFGNLLKLDGGSLPYVVPLIAQSTMSLDIRSLFFAMVFIANSGALMDLSMDIASASEELILHKPDITRRELLLSGFSVGRSVHRHHDHHADAGLLRQLPVHAHVLCGPGHAPGGHRQSQVCGQRGAHYPGGLLRAGDGGALHRHYRQLALYPPPGRARLPGSGAGLRGRFQRRNGAGRPLRLSKNLQEVSEGPQPL